MDVNEIISLSGMKSYKIRNIYCFGSHLYGTNSEESDHDIAIVGAHMLPYEEIKAGDYDIHIFTPDHFQDLLDKSYCKAIECIKAPPQFILQENMQFRFNPSPNKLVCDFLQQSNTSWNTAKIKIREGDIWKGKKGIFHALRILAFGVQLKRFGTIVEWNCASRWNEIKIRDWFNWKDYSNQYKPRLIELEKFLKES